MHHRMSVLKRDLASQVFGNVVYAKYMCMSGGCNGNSSKSIFSTLDPRSLVAWNVYKCAKLIPLPIVAVLRCSSRSNMRISTFTH